MIDACSIFIACETARLSASCVRFVHKRAIIAQIIYALEDYLRLWPSFFRIVSLFLITRRTFNQSMDKNIWMPYIINLYVLHHISFSIMIHWTITQSGLYQGNNRPHFSKSQRKLPYKVWSLPMQYWAISILQRLCSPVHETFSYGIRHIPLWFNGA